MRIPTLPLPTLALLAAAGHAAAPADLKPQLDPARQAIHAPALAGAIIRDGVVIGVGVCGVRALGDNAQPATLQDRWPVGSCTKPMTRFMIGRLMERGEIDANATLAALLPEAPMLDDYKQVPLSLVLAHKAGIQQYTEIGPKRTPIIFELQGAPMAQRAAFVNHVLQEQPAAKPGSRFVYSNAGYCVAAVAAETKTGKPWEQLIKDEVLTPLNMAASVAGPEPDADNQPRGHIRTPDGFHAPREPWGYLAVMGPAGGVKATAEDFARFAAAHADAAAGRAVGGLSAATAKRVAEMGPTDGPPGAAASPEMFFGGDGQYTAAFAVWPQQRVAIAVVSNAGEADDLCETAIEAIRAALTPDIPKQDQGSMPAAAPAGGPPPAPGPGWGILIKAEGDDLVLDQVAPGSLAEKAGLKAGDVIAKINGKPVAELSREDRSAQIKATQVKLTVTRGGKPVEIELKR